MTTTTVPGGLNLAALGAAIDAALTAPEPVAPEPPPITIPQAIVAPVTLEQAIEEVVEKFLTGNAKATQAKREALTRALAETLMALPVYEVLSVYGHIPVDQIDLGNAIIGVDANGCLESIVLSDGGYVTWDFA